MPVERIKTDPTRWKSTQQQPRTIRVVAPGRVRVRILQEPFKFGGSICGSRPNKRLGSGL